MLLAIVEKPDDNREEIAEVGIDQENSPHIAVKQRLENFKLWYRDTLVQAESTSPGLFQQKQADFEGKVVANAGISAAQKEHQIKQQLKQFFQTIVTNLES